MNRRDWIRSLGLGTLATSAAALPSASAFAAPSPASRSMDLVKITRVRAFATRPNKVNLIVVKVETSEPGLYGLGCATFTQRPTPVLAAVADFLDPFARGRDVSNIEDLWQNAYTSSYWRNGPVLNNALSGLDMALWDIQGKRAGMPVYQLLGGKCRFAVDCYSHASGRDLKEVEDSVRSKLEQGFRHVRIQMGSYGSEHLSTRSDFKDAGFGMPQDRLMESQPYIKATLKMFEHVRNVFGDEPELLHDVHERIEPRDAIRFLKELEKYRPFFIEDPLPPEANDYFRQMRAATTVPIAMGELFNSPHEWIPLIKDRLIDFIRVHLSQTGGFSVARKIATLAEMFNVRSAWHGPGDVSPVGHAANFHLDLAIHNFGIQEYSPFNDATQDIFSGCPTLKNGYVSVNEAPGWGVDFNEEAAKKYPIDKPERPAYWDPVRRRDGTAVRP
ncbi:MAG: starvation-sensing protein RspA [Verrucomicrobia bacterium]|nr:starvation-sensing protein RspA [Verrucomicrobiota bacterium]MBI3871231.1 starvation-sensing protein RspA [Verrucomicrobiota bacterium]